MELPTHDRWLLAGAFADDTRDRWCSGRALSIRSAGLAGMVFVAWTFSIHHPRSCFHDLESSVLCAGESFLRFVGDRAFLLLRRNRMANADRPVGHFAIICRHPPYFF